MDGRCSCTSGSIERPVTTQAWSGEISGATRAKVSCIILFPLGSGRNCLGKDGVLSGHRRVPLPPARMTTCKCSMFYIYLTSYYIYKPHHVVLAHIFDARIV